MKMRIAITQIFLPNLRIFVQIFMKSFALQEKLFFILLVKNDNLYVCLLLNMLINSLRYRKLLFEGRRRSACLLS